MGNYSFGKDLEVAKKTEQEIAGLLRKSFGDDTEVKFCDSSEFDIEFWYNGKTYTIEVKEDFRCMLTKNVCVEFECRGKPSGIAVSTARYFLYKIHESPVKFGYYLCTTEKLRRMIAEEKYFRIFEAGGDEGSNTKGYLFKVDAFKAFCQKL